MESIFESNMISVLGLGFILGLRHAVDVDHVVAISTIVSERRGFLSASIVGMLWGLGHTASLLAVGLLVVAMDIRISEKAALAMEFAVAAMLIVLGLRVIWKMFHGGRIHVHLHTHGKKTHAHIHLHDKAKLDADGHSHHAVNAQWLTKKLLTAVGNGKQSVLVGMVHGFAGSGALMLIVLAMMPSVTLGLQYIVAFGFGSIVGMSLMSTLIGVPFVFTSHRFEKLNFAVRGIAGIGSLVFGLLLVWQIGLVSGLFL